MRRFTLMVKPECEREALERALDFIKTYPDHFRDKDAIRHGVGYKLNNDNYYYIYGNAAHIRVRQSEN